MINLSTINPLSLPSLPLRMRRDLPKCSCVYFVIQCDKVLYIGMTKNLLLRWSGSHHIYQEIKDVKNTHIAWLEMSGNMVLFETEQRLITYFKPPLNLAPIQTRHIPFEKNIRVTVNISRFWRNDMTVTQVAKDLDMNTRSIRSLKNGTERGDWATLVKLSRYFQVPVEDLLEIEESDNQNNQNNSILAS